jgi:hypothetical protein
LAPGKTVSEDWLREGAGEMFRAEATEDRMVMELLGVYRQLWDENKTAVNKHAKFLLGEQKESGATRTPGRGVTTKKTV